MAPARHRLPPDVRPTDYELHLHPDLEAGTFQGEVAIAVEIGRPRAAVTLHAVDLAVRDATVRIGETDIPARVRVDRAEETVTLHPRRRLPAGPAVLRLRFAGRLGTHLRGLYGARSGDHRYAFTQCETADCRRIMPCFDEPSFKARFRVAVTARDGDTVLSNAPIENEERLGAGLRRVRFAPTPPLSTYLLALAIGPLEATTPRRCGTTPVRVWHVPGKGHLAAFGLEAAVESLRRLEAYFDLPYPYAKLDLVAVPDFEAGAMENAGAVFFRETLLLLDPATASLPERKRAAEVIAHELAHMWYGDLVTMAWWDDLWLNEAFATWMAYRVVDDWKPEWRMWHGFEHDRASALALDALTSTHPIYAPVRSVAEATENFDLITYEKGAAVVRMLEHWLGPETFRDGVRRYIRRHREGNAVAADLWRALSEASGRDVARVAQAWIVQPGFPLVSTRLGGARTPALAVRQERFFADPRVAATRRRTRWPVPLVVKLPGGAVHRALVEGAQATVRLPGARPSWYCANAEAGGFFRVRYDAQNQVALREHAQQALTAVERLALVGDQWALVRADRERIERFLELVAVLGDERDHDVLDGVAAALAVLDEQVVSREGPDRAALRAWIVRCFGEAFAALGWEAAQDEPDTVRLRRAALLRLVGGVAEAPEVLAEARRRLEAYLVDRGTLEPNLADTVVNLAARGGDLALHGRYREMARSAATPQEQRRFLLGLGVFRAPDAVRATLGLLLGPEVPTQDLAFVLVRLFQNPAGGERAWRFVQRRWTTLRKRIPPLMVARLVEATPALREPRFARELRAFFAARPVPEAARALRQALERFRLYAELRRRIAPPLMRWLSTHLQ